MATKPSKSNTAAVNTPGTLVLQWLTYAFWGLTILALAWLTTITVGHFINAETFNSGNSESIAYPLAAVVVFTLMSVVTDVFYSKREPQAKHGAATILMIVHAVIFALLAIIALVVAVFAVVRLLIGDAGPNNAGDDGAVTALITGLIIAAVYGATVLRTLKPWRRVASNKLYWAFMVLVSVAAVIAAIAGPALHARETRTDRLIERGLPQLSEVIRAETEKTGKLPASLTVIKDQASGDARDLIEQNLVEYKPGERIEPSELEKQQALDNPDVTRYAYELCVTYKAKSGTPYEAYPSYPMPGRMVSPDSYVHDAGRVCYQLQTGYGGYGEKYF